MSHTQCKRPRADVYSHKSYHPYNEKNKQRVREDEAKAQAEEEERERQRIDKDSSARLDALRRRAGSPTFAQVEEDAGDLTSTSSTKQDGIGGGLLERHRKAKLKAEKEEKKRKDRLDFEFPSETARKERARLEKYGPDPVEGLGGVDADKGREIKWESGGHLNLFADLEEVSRIRSELDKVELTLREKQMEKGLLPDIAWVNSPRRPMLHPRQPNLTHSRSTSADRTRRQNHGTRTANSSGSTRRKRAKRLRYVERGIRGKMNGRNHETTR